MLSPTVVLGVCVCGPCARVMLLLYVSHLLLPMACSSCGGNIFAQLLGSLGGSTQQLILMKSNEACAAPTDVSMSSKPISIHTSACKTEMGPEHHADHPGRILQEGGRAHSRETRGGRASSEDEGGDTETRMGESHAGLFFFIHSMRARSKEAQEVKRGEVPQSGAAGLFSDRRRGVGRGLRAAMDASAEGPLEGPDKRHQGAHRRAEEILRESKQSCRSTRATWRTSSRRSRRGSTNRTARTGWPFAPSKSASHAWRWATRSRTTRQQVHEAPRPRQPRRVAKKGSHAMSSWEDGRTQRARRRS